MYAKDLINKDNKIKKYYFAKKERQISLNVYKDFFIIIQQFGKNNAVKYKIEYLEKCLKTLKKETKLVETIKYKNINQ